MPGGGADKATHSLRFLMPAPICWETCTKSLDLVASELAFLKWEVLENKSPGQGYTALGTGGVGGRLGSCFPRFVISLPPTAPNRKIELKLAAYGLPKTSPPFPATTAAPAITAICHIIIQPPRVPTPPQLQPGPGFREAAAAAASRKQRKDSARQLGTDMAAAVSPGPPAPRRQSLLPVQVAPAL